jgi:phage-related protein
MGPRSDKPLVWLHGEVKTPPFSSGARVETGVVLRRLQRGENIGMPLSEPMPIIGKRCHQLRVRDVGKNWRIVYRTDVDAVVILEVFEKTTRTTPDQVIDTCKKRLKLYDSVK